MPAIRVAVSTVKITIVGIQVLSTFVVVEGVQKTDTVRPGVIRTYCDPLGRAPLHGQQEAVIVAGSSVFAVIQDSDVLSILRPFEIELPAKIGVAGRGACGCRGSQGVAL